MKTFDIDDAFEEFMRKVNPEIAESSAQYKESRRVFFAGVAAIYSFWMGEVTLMSDDDAMKTFRHVDKQLDDFRKRVGFNV